MDKKGFLNRINCEDKLLLSNLFDKINISYKTGKTIYTNEFFTPNIWLGLQQISKDLGVFAYCDGIFGESERRMLAFGSNEPCTFPYKLLCIKNRSKFIELMHKDYLGAIMGLGINRNKIGDLVLKNNLCYVAVSEDICEYIIDNLKEIGNSPCLINILNLEENDIPTINFEEKYIISTALRVDCIVSSLCNLSRNNALDLIKSGNVYVDYVPVKEKDFTVAYESTITIRGYGKYKLIKNVGYTGSQRMKLLTKKFV